MSDQDTQPNTPKKPRWTLMLPSHPGPLTEDEQRRLVEQMRKLAGLPPLPPLPPPDSQEEEEEGHHETA